MLQSIERFTEPKEVNSPVLIMIIGGAGIASNVLMAVIMGSESMQVRNRNDLYLTGNCRSSSAGLTNISRPPWT